MTREAKGVGEEEWEGRGKGEWKRGRIDKVTLAIVVKKLPGCDPKIAT